MIRFIDLVARSAAVGGGHLGVAVRGSGWPVGPRALATTIPPRFRTDRVLLGTTAGGRRTI